MVTADGGYRRGAIVPLKQNADESVAETPSIQHVVVVRRTGGTVDMQGGRDLWWHEAMARASAECPVEAMDSEDMLYILYTSGTTGKPKGIVHTTGGYLLGVTTTFQWIFDWRESDIWWCAADIGWVTGHSYIVYGPLSSGATSVMYEGTPDYPARDRWWQIVERYKVSLIYMAPTAIRSFMKWGTELPAKRDLSSLRLLGSVGEPINPEAWIWYYDHIGRRRCPIVDTWWQTETGMILITPLPGITTLKPGSATRPFPGVEAEIVDEKGRPANSGYLILKRPWPAMARTLYKDAERFKEVYWSRFPGMYFTGDGAKRDGDGDFWLLGRVDDVMNVAGHRISTYEVESALVDHAAVAEAAVIGKTHEVKGQAISAFVTLKEGRPGTAGAHEGAERARGQEDRGNRPSRRHHLRGRAAEDAQREDHAAPPSRRGRGARSRRYDDARRRHGRSRLEGQVRGQGSLTGANVAARSMNANEILSRRRDALFVLANGDSPGAASVVGGRSDRCVQASTSKPARVDFDFMETDLAKARIHFAAQRFGGESGNVGERYLDSRTQPEVAHPALAKAAGAEPPLAAGDALERLECDRRAVGEA